MYNSDWIQFYAKLKHMQAENLCGVDFKYEPNLTKKLLQCCMDHMTIIGCMSNNLRMKKCQKQKANGPGSSFAQKKSVSSSSRGDTREVVTVRRGL